MNKSLFKNISEHYTWRFKVEQTRRVRYICSRYLHETETTLLRTWVTFKLGICYLNLIWQYSNQPESLLNVTILTFFPVLKDLRTYLPNRRILLEDQAFFLPHGKIAGYQIEALNPLTQSRVAGCANVVMIPSTRY